jgi:hypothetical protein
MFVLEVMNFVQKLTVLLVIPRVQEMCGMVLAAVLMLWLLSLAISLLLMILFCNHESANDCARTVIIPWCMLHTTNFYSKKHERKNCTAVYTVSQVLFFTYMHISTVTSLLRNICSLLCDKLFEQCSQIPKLFSGQYIKKVGPILEKVRPLSIKGQCNTHTKGQLKMKWKFFFVSISVSVPLNKEFI